MDFNRDGKIDAKDYIVLQGVDVDSDRNSAKGGSEENYKGSPRALVILWIILAVLAFISFIAKLVYGF